MAENTSAKPAIGLDSDKLEHVVEMLTRTLADYHVLYMKLRNYHWNVTGTQFFALHAVFEEQYTAFSTVIDDVAERIRQYGAFAPGTLKEMLELARLSEEAPGMFPEAAKMAANIAADHEAMIRQLREDIEKIDDEYDDDALEGYYTELLDQHMKMAWMLRAFVSGA
jgi:starvation-inducible DNA-binding protein